MGCSVAVHKRKKEGNGFLWIYWDWAAVWRVMADIVG